MRLIIFTTEAFVAEVEPAEWARVLRAFEDGRVPWMPYCDPGTGKRYLLNLAAVMRVGLDGPEQVTRHGVGPH